MIPKIEFRYSHIYDERYRNSPKTKKILKKRKATYHSYRTILNYIKKIEPIWKKHEKKVLSELSKVSGLKWREDKIIVYVIGHGIPFSDPLTMPVYKKDDEYFTDTLVHELIHQLFVQGDNLEKTKKSWDYVFRKYKKEDFKTKVHIPLHAIHSHIYLKFFTKKRMEKDIKNISFLPSYRKSWEIVQKEGYKNIINEFKKRIK